MAIAFRAASSAANQNTAAAITIPSGVQTGDLMLAEFYLNTANALTVPAGWTQLGTTLVPGVAQQAILCYKIASNTDGGSTLSMALGGTAKWDVVVSAYSGCDGTTPVDAASSFVKETVAGTTHATPAVTVGPSNAWAVFGVQDRGSPGSTSFSISSGSVQSQTAGTGGGGSSSAAVADSAGTVATGALAARTWTCTVSATAATMFTVILNPATTTSTTAQAHVPGHFSKALLDNLVAGGGSAATAKIRLMAAGYTYDKDAQTYWSDINSHEVAAGFGYATGGQVLASPVTSYSATTHRTAYSSAANTFTASGGSIVAIGAAIVFDTGNPATSPFVWLDFGGAVTTSGQLILTPDAVLGWFFGGLLSSS